MSAQTYTVEAVHETKEKPDKGNGPMRSVYMDLKGEGQVEWYQKASTAVPKQGDTLYGTVTDDPKWGKKFKKEQQGNNGGWKGGGSKDYKADPEKLRAENMRSSLHAAVDYVVAMKQAGEDVKSEHVDALARRWYRLVTDALKEETA